MGYFLWILLLLTGLRPAPATSDPNDESCLTHFYSSLLDPALKNWTRPNFATPCNGFDSSHLSGATCNNARIYRLSLSNLSLRGTLSPLLSLCSNLQHLDLSGNFLAGKIPPQISNLSNLALLNLAGNRFSGQIPASLYLCNYLNVIDLHNNQLVGPVPQELGLLIRLSSFDVSYNKLSGMIPGSIGNRTGNLVKFNATSFEGNGGLYGYPLDPYKKKGLSVGVIVLIGLGSGLVSLVVSFGVVCVWLRVSQNNNNNNNNNMVVAQGKINNLMPDY